MPRSRHAAAFAACVLLAVLHTWPLARHPGRLSLNDNADAQLNEWILAWIAHQLPRDPAHLFEGNIFYPAHDALAFSEPLIVPALIGAPLAWSGASPVLVYNLVLMLGFALTAFAACIVVQRWTGSMTAGLAAGSAFAFNTHTLTRLAHVQGIHIYGLPIALFAIDRLIVAASWRSAALLAAALVLLTWTSGYLAVFAFVMVAIALAVRAHEWIPNARRVVPRLAAAVAVAAILIAPVYLPYARVAREQHMVRTLESVRDFSATPAGYLATAGRFHFAIWSRWFFKDPVDSFFPGVTILVLAAIAMGAAIRGEPNRSAALRRRAAMLAAIAAIGVLLSLGTATPVYGWLFAVFPPMRGLRAAARFGNLFLLAIAMLGGLGLARIRRPWLAALLVLLVNLESLRAPIAYAPFTGIPRIYRLLADEPGPVVIAEQPFFPRHAIFENGPYVLAATAHWRPLMNGYSGYTPASYQPYADAFWYFPQDWAIQAMKDAGVTHVVVHPARFARDHQDVLPALEQRADFELMAIGHDGIRLYRLKR
jgi:hypothetical protein